MTDNDTTSAIVEEFLGRIRIGDIPDVDGFISELSPAGGDTTELKGLLSTLLDVERLTVTSASDDLSLLLPDLSAAGYRLLKKIGAGGMGVVYEALQINLGRHVAVKLLRPELLTDPEIVRLFRLEARILARFNHPGIVSILETGQCGDIFFYVMELAEGRHLDSLAQPPDEHQLLQWACEASDAIACAHGHGIIHGDIKPANLLLDKDGHVRICDFGLAFAAPTPRRSHGANDGTRRYMAPELLNGGIKDFAADQYALCASLVELALGRPFDRDGDHARALRNAQFAAVLDKGLGEDPKSRYPAVCDLRDDLRRITQHEPVTAVPTPVFVRIHLFCRRHPIHAVTATLLVLFLSAVLIGLIRTEAALKLAKHNAETANAAIGKVFDEMVELPPAPENADLLAQLVPYYEQIVGNPNIPPSELTGALTQLAQTALHTGNYPLAERTLRRLRTLDESSSTLCRLANVLYRQGKRDESAEIFRKIVARYSEGTPSERLDAARARLHFMQTEPDGDHEDDRQAVRRILADHLAAAPDDDEALFLHAQFLRLGESSDTEPVHGQSEDPLEILDELSTRNPNNSRYWLAFIDCATDWLNTADEASECPEAIESALTKSDIMLWRFLNRPHTVSAALALKRAYNRRLRPSDSGPRSERGRFPVAILTRILLNQPNLPEQDQTDLIANSLDAMEDVLRRPRRSLFETRRHNPHNPRREHLRREHLEDLKLFLDRHPLPRKDEFLRRIGDLEASDTEP